MNVFPAKLVVVLAVYLLLSVSLATSARLPFEGWNAGSLHISSFRDGSGKISSRIQSSFGFENLDISDKDIVPSRSLRSLILPRPPPAPVKSKSTSMNSAAPPPLVA